MCLYALFICLAGWYLKYKIKEIVSEWKRIWNRRKCFRLEDIGKTCLRGKICNMAI